MRDEGGPFLRLGRAKEVRVRSIHRAQSCLEVLKLRPNPVCVRPIHRAQSCLEVLKLRSGLVRLRPVDGAQACLEVLQLRPHLRQLPSPTEGNDEHDPTNAIANRPAHEPR
jgi:hypothetical protein